MEEHYLRLTCSPNSYSATILIPPWTTCPGSTVMPTGQSDGGIFSDKVPSFQMTPSHVSSYRSKPTQALHVTTLTHSSPQAWGGSLWTKEQKDFKNKGGNFKENLSRQKREDTNINSHWLWKYALILHKFNLASQRPELGLGFPVFMFPRPIFSNTYKQQLNSKKQPSK